jgi:hypothetical protein
MIPQPPFKVNFNQKPFKQKKVKNKL